MALHLCCYATHLLCWIPVFPLPTLIYGSVATHVGICRKWIIWNVKCGRPAHVRAIFFNELKNNCNQDDFTTGSDSMISYASSRGACPTRCERQPQLCDHRRGNALTKQNQCDPVGAEALGLRCLECHRADSSEGAR